MTEEAFNIQLRRGSTLIAKLRVEHAIKRLSVYRSEVEADGFNSSKPLFLLKDRFREITSCIKIVDFGNEKPCHAHKKNFEEAFCRPKAFGDGARTLQIARLNGRI